LATCRGRGCSSVAAVDQWATFPSRCYGHAAGMAGELPGWQAARRRRGARSITCFGAEIRNDLGTVRVDTSLRGAGARDGEHPGSEFQGEGGDQAEHRATAWLVGAGPGVGRAYGAVRRAQPLLARRQRRVLVQPAQPTRTTSVCGRLRGRCASGSSRSSGGSYSPGRPRPRRDCLRRGMQRWWISLKRGEQITVIGLAVTLLVGLVGVLPAYLAFFAESDDASPTTLPVMSSTISAPPPSTNESAGTTPSSSGTTDTVSGSAMGVDTSDASS
jgi:hypothetical protein